MALSTADTCSGVGIKTAILDARKRGASLPASRTTAPLDAVRWMDKVQRQTWPLSTVRGKDVATSEDHHRLVAMGARWFKRQGFAVVATELASYRNREQPDVYACRHTCSAVAEVKVSRTDFLADKKKPERQAGGLGSYRFYLCPEELIHPSELPTGWGLLYSQGRSIIAVHAPQGNLWPRPGHDNPQWLPFTHDVDPDLERAALFSVARRLAAGKPTYK